MTQDQGDGSKKLKKTTRVRSEKIILREVAGRREGTRPKLTMAASVGVKKRTRRAGNRGSAFARRSARSALALLPDDLRADIEPEAAETAAEDEPTPASLLADEREPPPLSSGARVSLGGVRGKVVRVSSKDPYKLRVRFRHGGGKAWVRRHELDDAGAAPQLDERQVASERGSALRVLVALGVCEDGACGAGPDAASVKQPDGNAEPSAERVGTSVEAEPARELVAADATPATPDARRRAVPAARDSAGSGFVPAARYDPSAENAFHFEVGASPPVPAPTPQPPAKPAAARPVGARALERKPKGETPPPGGPGGAAAAETRGAGAAAVGPAEGTQASDVPAAAAPLSLRALFTQPDPGFSVLGDVLGEQLATGGATGGAAEPGATEQSAAGASAGAPTAMARLAGPAGEPLRLAEPGSAHVPVAVSTAAVPPTAAVPLPYSPQPLTPRLFMRTRPAAELEAAWRELRGRAFHSFRAKHKTDRRQAAKRERRWAAGGARKRGGGGGGAGRASGRPKPQAS